MGSFSTFQQRAIKWYVERSGLTLHLPATFPTISYSDADGNSGTQNIIFIEQWYRAHLLRLKREQAKQEKHQ